MEDSLKKRYVIKLLSSIINGIIGILIVAIVPKALGPVSFGQFSYLQQFFSQIIAFLDAGTSTAFFTKLSAKNSRKELIGFYGVFSFLLLAALTFVFFSLDKMSYLQYLLPDIPTRYVYLGLLFGFISWLLQVFIKISDAYALTVSVEIIKVFQKVFSLFLIFILVNYYTFNLDVYFYFHFFVLALLIFMISIIFIKKEVFSKKLNSARIHFFKLTKEFFDYSKPLFVFNIIGISVGLFDIWLLQRTSGSIETGFYGLAYSIAGMCFLFTGAMTPIITREFSKYFSENNMEKVRSLFKRYIPMLYAIATYFGVFLAFQSENLLLLFTDEKYQGAYLALVIMSFYPLHQTYGQLSGSIFFASEKTEQYKNIGAIVSLVGIIFSAVLIYLLELGAVGFALKMVLVQIIGVNIQLYYNVKMLDMSIFPFVKHQLYTIAFFVILAYLSTLLTTYVDATLWNFLLSGALYTFFVAVGIFFFPMIVSLSKKELQQIVKTMLHRKNKS